MNNKKNIAIIGAGIAGLSSAYHLHNDYHVTIFEKEDYLGGHTDTHEFVIDEQTVRVDSGFIVFCKQFYPHFSSMLDDLGVESQPTQMSFSAYNKKTGTVYNATSINSLFCQRKNLFNPKFYGMLYDLIRFYRQAPAVLDGDDVTTSVEQYLQQNKYGDRFINDHLFPMISALWSATPERVAQFPIHHLVDFLYRHGMMKLINRPEWLVVKNGSRSYVEALLKKLNCEWKTNSHIESISRNDNGVEIKTDNETHHFDAVILATHSDQALSLLEQPSDDEINVLGKIKYEKNHVVVHTDEDIMHSNKASWASWNTQVPHEFEQNTLNCCTANYWMNLLQSLPVKTNVFTTLNSHHQINPEKILLERSYAHPIFTADSVSAQKDKTLINGKNHTYYAGAYWGWGFHEDGARSAYESTELLKQQLS